MNTNTKYFGDIEYEEKDIILFDEGLYGFEEYKRYILIHFEADDDALLCLQSLQDENLAFVLMNPFLLSPSYSPDVAQEDMEALEISDSTPTAFYSICVVRDTVAESTVNLKCPLIVNNDTRRGRQAMLENREYTYRHLLGEFPSAGKEASNC